MKSFLLLFLLATAAFAARPAPPPPSDAAVQRVRSFYTETLPPLRLREVSLAEALEQVGMAWQKSHPKEMFPVAIADYRYASGMGRGEVERITVDFLDIPYIEALQQLARLSGRELQVHGGIVQFVSHEYVIEDYVTSEHPVSPEVIAALGLKPDSDSAEIRRAFERYGMEFNQYMKFWYDPSHSRLVVMSFIPQQNQITGILFLLGKGFHISK